MKSKYILFFLFIGFLSNAQDTVFIIKGFAIAAPKSSAVAQFNQFVINELAPRQINTLVLRVDFNFQYQSHPELQDSFALSISDVKSIVKTCKQNGIDIIPQINLLGHQSWHSKTTKLLSVYPQFDETPDVKMPEEYKWPNADGLYCKSYCPLHPGIHKIVFELVDEICNAFESKAFHAGMDEVFYIGEDKCPRCGGKDKAELFANEIRIIRDRLMISDRELWIWGDRLLDGKSTGMGMWEASMNNTHRAIDMIPKDVVICDWHYERPDQSPVLLAAKGLRVITCPWNRPEVALTQAEDMARWRKYATKTMKPQYFGMMQTVWTSFENFQKEMEQLKMMKPEAKNGRTTSADCFVQLFNKISEIEK